MNKCPRIPLDRLVRSSLAAALLMLAVSPGCENPFDETRFETLRIPEQRLREVENLDISAYNRSDTVEVPPATSNDKPAPANPGTPANPSTPPAPPPPAETTLTIEDCRSLALQHNLELKVELLNPAIARQSITEEEARFEAIIFGGVTFSRNDTPISSTLEGSQTRGLTSDVGVRLPLTTGGSLSASLPISRFETDNSFSTLNPAFTTDFAASISQPLLRNGGVRVNTHPLRIARLQYQSTESRTKLQVMRIIADVDRLYWRLYGARRELEVRKREYDLAVALLEKARRRVAVGLGSEIDVTRAESGAAERLEAIIQSEVSLRQRQRELKQAINKPGLEISGPTILVPATPPNPIQYKLDGSRLAAAAMEKRMELLELEIQLAQDRSTIDVMRNQVLPMLNLDYTYNVNSLGGSLSDSFDTLARKNFEDHRVGLRMEIPLGNQAAESRLRRSLYTRIQTFSTIEARRMVIRQEVLNVVDRIEADWQRILASRQRTILAARTLEGEQRQFDLELRTSTDVLDAQTRLADAQTAEVRALADYQISQVDLAVATGTLLGSARIRWEPLTPDIKGRISDDRDMPSNAPPVRPPATPEQKRHTPGPDEPLVAPVP